MSRIANIVTISVKLALGLFWRGPLYFVRFWTQQDECHWEHRDGFWIPRGPPARGPWPKPVEKDCVTLL